MKKLFIAILILFLTISAVNAENETQSSFSDLQTLIDDAGTNAEINLTTDYIYSSQDTQEVEIFKSVTINGNNHVIDGNHTSQILHIDSVNEQGMNVILKDIIFINGKSEYNGGAVYADGYNGKVLIINCTFINNTAENEGGAVCQLHSNIYNCTFINNTAPLGGAVSQFYSTIDHSTFIGNTAEYGGAVAQEGKSIINNSKFSENTAEFSGGAVYQTNYMMGQPITENSEFYNNSAQYGGAIFTENGIVRNCTFENNTASVEGDDIYEYTEPDFIDDVPNALESDYDHISAEEIKKQTDPNQTGNPLMLLLAALIIPIFRNKD